MPKSGVFIELKCYTSVGPVDLHNNCKILVTFLDIADDIFDAEYDSGKENGTSEVNVQLRLFVNLLLFLVLSVIYDIYLHT